MKFGLLSLIAVLSFSGLSQAANHSFQLQNSMPPEAVRAERNWNKLLDIISETGTIVTTAYGGDYLFVQNIEPEDTSKSHRADYFSLVGGHDDEGIFRFGRVEIVSEDWQLNVDGNWIIDQYLITVSLDGQVKRATHVDMIQTKDRHVLKHESQSLDHATATAQWTNILDGWYARIGLD